MSVSVEDLGRYRGGERVESGHKRGVCEQGSLRFEIRVDMLPGKVILEEARLEPDVDMRRYRLCPVIRDATPAPR